MARLGKGDPVEDSKIILLMQNSPSEGLCEAIAKYNGLVTAVVTRILRANRQDVEECVSDAFVNVWKSIHRLDPRDSSLKGYLLCTARNVALNRLKALGRHPAAYLEDSPEPTSEENVELSVLKEEDHKILMDLIDGMTEPDREILLRKHFFMEPVKEIATRLAMDPVQVKNRLYLGKKKLKKLLEEKGVST